MTYTTNTVAATINVPGFALGGVTTNATTTITFQTSDLFYFENHPVRMYVGTQLVDTSWDGQLFPMTVRHDGNAWIWEVSEEGRRAQRRAELRMKHARKLVNHRGEQPRALGRHADFASVTQEEALALQLLRRMVPPEEFRKYLKHGFVGARGASGLEYEVRRRGLIMVRDRGTVVATLCVHLKDICPPTDEVVAKVVMIECDEPEVWVRANVTWRQPRDKATAIVPFIEMDAKDSYRVRRVA